VDRPLRPVALLEGAAVRGPEEARGAAELAALLGAPAVGEPAAGREAGWEEDLRDGRGPLREAAALVDEALAAGERPLLLAPDCAVALATVPALLRVHPGAWVLWLDAHGDANTPATTESGYLGGMALSGALGWWDAGVGDGPALDPARVVLGGVRDLDAPEADLLAGVGRLEEGASVPDGAPVLLHVDLDVLDPALLAVRFPAPGGWSFERLREVLADVAARCDVVGAEVTSHAPGRATAVREALAPLLDR
jgi:arginase family enzyme